MLGHHTLPRLHRSRESSRAVAKHIKTMFVAFGTFFQVTAPANPWYMTFLAIRRDIQMPPRWTMLKNLLIFSNVHLKTCKSSRSFAASWQGLQRAMMRHYFVEARGLGFTRKPQRKNTHKNKLHLYRIQLATSSSPKS